MVWENLRCWVLRSAGADWAARWASSDRKGRSEPQCLKVKGRHRQISLCSLAGTEASSSMAGIPQLMLFSKSAVQLETRSQSGLHWNQTQNDPDVDSIPWIFIRFLYSSDITYVSNLQAYEGAYYSSVAFWLGRTCALVENPSSSS